MAVVATAGHVDHGKSTLVRLLTGQEPDRWAEERRRGLTIDLGYAWTDIDGRRVSLVDVPGHEHFTGNMLAGLGPVEAVLFVVAADDGWSAQSREHARAIAALGIRHVLLVVTRCDLVRGEPACIESLAELEGLGIPVAECVLVSGATGAGIPELRAAVGRLAVASSARVSARTGDDRAGEVPVRLWVDRSFTVRGAGTVATGTLGTGRISVGDQLALGGRAVSVRGLQTCGEEVASVVGPARVALNLRGVEVAEVRRGTALTGVGWPDHPTVLDVEPRALDVHPRAPGTTPEPAPEPAVEPPRLSRLPRLLTLHVGTAAVQVRTQQLGTGLVRLRLAHPLPVVVGDRAVLRDPGRHEVIAGVVVRAVDPPTRRQVRQDHAHRAAYPGRASDPPSEGAQALLAWLGDHPLQAPSRADLEGWGVTPAELAAAAAAGEVLRLGGLVLAGDVLTRAADAVRGLPQPFGVGDATRAMGTSRRVAVPVLERLDATLVTRRLPDGTREVRPVRP